MSVGRYRDRSKIERKEPERALHIKNPETTADFKMHKKISGPAKIQQQSLFTRSRMDERKHW